MKIATSRPRARIFKIFLTSILLAALMTAVDPAAVGKAQENCSQHVRAECLSRLGAGAISSNDECSVELQNYMNCLEGLASGKSGGIGMPGPVEIGPLILEIVRLIESEDPLHFVSLVDRLDKSVNWDKDTVAGAYLSTDPIVASLDLSFLGVPDRDPMGIEDNIYTLRVYTGTSNATRAYVYAISLDSGFTVADFKSYYESARNIGLDFDIVDCPGNNLAGAGNGSYMWSFKAYPNVTLIESNGLGSGGANFSLGFTRRGNEKSICELSLFDYEY